VGAPVQVPLLVVRVSPDWVVPLITGAVMLLGVPVTAAVALESAVADPPVLVAVTSTRMRASRSSLASVGWSALTPAMAAGFAVNVATEPGVGKARWGAGPGPVVRA
jgi:hypothetical protein